MPNAMSNVLIFSTGAWYNSSDYPSPRPCVDRCKLIRKEVVVVDVEHGGRCKYDNEERNARRDGDSLRRGLRLLLAVQNRLGWLVVFRGRRCARTRR